MVNVPTASGKRGVPPKPSPMNINSFGQNLNKGTLPGKIEVASDVSMINV